MHTIIAIVYTQLNGFKYCYLTLIILFNIDHLFAYSEVAKNNAIQHYSHICTQSKGFKYCYSTVTILFNITHSFAYS